MKAEETYIEKKTCDFYSCFCGTDISTAKHGIQFICSEERDLVLKGYGRRYTIFMLLRGDDCFVSYSPEYRDCFGEQRGNTDARELISAVSRKFPMKVRQLMVFRKERVFDYKKAKILKPADYPLYESFFKIAYPTVSNTDWLREYFENKAEKEMLFGYVFNGELVSVCDAPDMPYMEGVIQHTGVMTLAAYRRRGCARCCAALAAHHLIEMAVVPQWECAIDNKASIALAESIGYEKYAQAFFLEE